MTASATGPTFDPTIITRPAPVLLTHYTIIAACTLIAFPFTFLPLYFKYRTLTYRFDDKGVAMSWGLLWRREIYLTYRRIQDIHVTRGLIQRWLGLATVSLQTASGSSSAEMQIEGVLEAEQLRDFLYQQMRGARGHDEIKDAAPAGASNDDDTLNLLREIRDELHALNAARRPEQSS